MNNHGRRNKVPAPAIKPAEVAQPIGDDNAMSPPPATLRANRVSGITSWLANTPDGPYSSAPVSEDQGPTDQGPTQFLHNTNIIAHYNSTSGYGSPAPNFSNSGAARPPNAYVFGHPETLTANLSTLLFGGAVNPQAYDAAAAKYHQGSGIANTPTCQAGFQAHGQMSPRADLSYAGMASGLIATEPDRGHMGFQPLPNEGRLPQFDRSGMLFKNAKETDTYLKQAQWKPTMGLFGVPINSEDFCACIAKIYNSLVEVDIVWDMDTHPADYKKFLRGGDWSNPRDLQAMSVSIFNVLRTVQKDGTTGPVLRLPGQLRQPMENDINFTFAQRLHWTTFLLRHYKSHANRFMCQIGVETHIARIWSVLVLEESFREWWKSLDNMQKADCLIRHPYLDVTYGGARYCHPTPEEAQFWRVAVQAQAISSGVQPQGPQSAAQPSSTAIVKRPASEDLEAEAGPTKVLRPEIPSNAPPARTLSSYNYIPGTEAGSGEGELSLPQGDGVVIDEAWMECLMTELSELREGEYGGGF